MLIDCANQRNWMDQGQHSRDKLKRECVKKKLNYGTHICGDDRNIKLLGWKRSKTVCYWGYKVLVLATNEVSNLVWVQAILHIL